MMAQLLTNGLAMELTFLVLCLVMDLEEVMQVLLLNHNCISKQWRTIILGISNHLHSTVCSIQHIVLERGLTPIHGATVVVLVNTLQKVGTPTTERVIMTGTIQVAKD